MSFNLQLICLSNYSIDFRLSSYQWHSAQHVIMTRYNSNNLKQLHYEYFRNNNIVHWSSTVIILMCMLQVSTRCKRRKQSNTKQFWCNESTTNIDTIMFDKWCSITLFVPGWFGRGANIMPRLVPNWLSIIMVWRYNLINSILCAGRCI